MCEIITCNLTARQYFPIMESCKQTSRYQEICELFALCVKGNPTSAVKDIN